MEENTINTPKSGKEVKQEIKEFWENCGISIDEAIAELGYTSRQTLYNIWSSDQYLKPDQANRFVRAFDFNYQFLTTGEGELVDLSKEYNQALIDDLKSENFRLATLLHIGSAIIAYTANTNAVRAWEAINNKDLEKYLEGMRDLIKEKTGAFLPGQDLILFARIVCSKHLDEKLEQMISDANLAINTFYPNKQ